MASLIQTVGIVGAGTMGSGLAQKMAMENHTVYLLDKTEADLERGMSRIRQALEEATHRGVLTLPKKQEVLSRLHPVTEVEKLASTQLVIEAVYENLALKQELFRRLDGLLPPSTLLATNTSSFRVSDLAEGLSHPERVLGLHYFFHPAKNRLVEVVPHARTSGETFRQTWAWSQTIHKTPIRSQDTYGFVVNRFYVPFVNEAVRQLVDKIGTMEEIEVVAKELFGIGLGPFALMNVTGIPVNYHACVTLGEQFGEPYVPSPTLKSQTESGKLWPLKDLPKTVSPEKIRAIQERFLGLVSFIIGQMTDEAVCTPEDGDIGACTGLLWKKGPWALVTENLKQSQQLATKTAQKYGVPLPKCFSSAKTFPLRPRTCVAEKDGHVGRLILKNPDQRNSFNKESLADFTDAFSFLDQDKSIDTIIIEALGKAFSAGADIKFIRKGLLAGEHTLLEQFVDIGAKLLLAIDRSSKLVIAKVHAPAYGAGAELALSADCVLLADEADLQFPETGLGLFPGFGGTQRMTLFCTVPVAKLLIYTGMPVRGQLALDLGCAEYTCPLGELESLTEAVLANTNRVTKQFRNAATIPTYLEACVKMIERYRIDELLNPKFQCENDPASQQALAQIRKKSPTALRLAERSVQEGYQQRKFEDALKIELALFKEAVRHADTLQGISAFLDKTSRK